MPTLLEDISISQQSFQNNRTKTQEAIQLEENYHEQNIYLKKPLSQENPVVE